MGIRQLLKRAVFLGLFVLLGFLGLICWILLGKGGFCGVLTRWGFRLDLVREYCIDVVHVLSNVY
jgi:hypothetical protein